MATRFLTGSTGRLTAFVLDVVAVAGAYAFTRLTRRDTRS